MTEDAQLLFVVWALALGAVSAVSLPLGSLVGLNIRMSRRIIAMFAAFGAGALMAALSVEQEQGPFLDSRRVRRGFKTC